IIFYTNKNKMSIDVMGFFMALSGHRIYISGHSAGLRFFYSLEDVLQIKRCTKTIMANSRMESSRTNKGWIEGEIASKHVKQEDKTGNSGVLYGFWTYITTCVLFISKICRKGFQNVRMVL
ncbi:MAG: hypothetical protein ABF904_14645, partial [Ethanoligenens sp.]